MFIETAITNQSQLRRSRMFIETAMTKQSQLRRSAIESYLGQVIHCAPTELSLVSLVIFYRHCIPTGFLL
jgi:hypothetical protein